MSSSSTLLRRAAFTPRSVRFLRHAAAGLLALGVATGALAQLRTNVPYERIRNSASEPGNWLTYGGNYSAHRYSLLTEITPANVANLKPLWVYQQNETVKWEVTPLIVDGVMYITERPTILTALDARTGRILWTYRRPAMPADVRICCGTNNRGLTVLGDAVYFNTFDSHLVCIDANTGLERWDKVVIDYRLGYSMTGAPLAVKDKIIVGVAGGEFGIRGFVDAYDAKTGERAWRFYSIPAKGEPGNETWGPGDSWKTGSAATWVTGSFDPDLNLIYWGTGNPGPSYNGDDRPGDNLWANSVVAIDADTGKLKWGFQMTPHDLHDWDSCQVPILVDTVVDGKPRKLLSFTNRNGFHFAIDRTNGQFVGGRAFAKQTWAKGLDDSGRPIVLPNTSPTPEGNLVYPGLGGSSNWAAPAYNPLTNMIYVQATEDYGQYFYKQVRPYEVGEHFENGGGRNVMGEEPYGVLKAIEAHTGKVVWGFQMQNRSGANVLSTVTGLVFSGTAEGDFFALDAKDGKLLWSFPGGKSIGGGAVSFLVDGKQRIAVPIGGALFVFGL
jgi:alcohol dehydrogenase (cytochrome c)